MVVFALVSFLYPLGSDVTPILPYVQSLGGMRGIPLVFSLFFRMNEGSNVKKRTQPIITRHVIVWGVFDPNPRPISACAHKIMRRFDPIENEATNARL